MTRMRIVAWIVQPVVMADDGENLTPVQVGPQQIPAAQWEAFKAGGDDKALDQLRAQIEGPIRPLPDETHPGQPPATREVPA